MGASSSTRTLEIENPMVITLSDGVVDKLRGHEQSVLDGDGSLSLPAFVQPSSLEIQRIVQQKLDENDKRWEQRLRHINDTQNAQNRKVEIEYKRTYESVKNLLPQIGDGVLSKTVKENENNLLDCLVKNNGEPLNCTDTIKNYQRMLFQSKNQQI